MIRAAEMWLFLFILTVQLINMIKDSLNSILDNIKERTTNPFFGTLIVVWLIHNWSLVYSLFYFDSDYKLASRLNFINCYYEEKPFIINLLHVVLITVGVLVFTYVMLSISRFITDCYEKLVIPKIAQWTDKNSVVLKSDYIIVKEALQTLELKLENERLAKASAQTERDVAITKLAELQKQRDEDNAEIGRGSSEQETYKRVYNVLRSDNGLSNVNETIQKIQNKYTVDPADKIIKTLLQEDFINRDKNTSATGRYIFTDEGKKFIRYWNNNTLE